MANRLPRNPGSFDPDEVPANGTSASRFLLPAGPSGWPTGRPCESVAATYVQLGEERLEAAEPIQPAAIEVELKYVAGRADGWSIVPRGSVKGTPTRQPIRPGRFARNSLTGGALLGDRVRMESVALDPGVFIRSMATRGSLGGLAAATREVADVLDAFGFDRLVIETVGVGQSELDVARTADSTALILVPESGDSIQTLKAGVMEVADIFVVNKADRPGADRLRNDVELMLGLRKGVSFGNVPAHHGVDLKRMNPARAARETAAAENPTTWTPPVLSAVATRQEGIGDIIAALDRHFAYLQNTGTLRARRRERMRERVMDVVETKVRDRLWKDSNTMTWLEEQLPSVEEGRSTPFAVADQLLRQRGELVRGEKTN